MLGLTCGILTHMHTNNPYHMHTYTHTQALPSYTMMLTHAHTLHAYTHVRAHSPSYVHPLYPSPQAQVHTCTHTNNP